MLKPMQETSVNEPSSQFWREPKSLAPKPPAKEFAPTGSRLKPMPVTTQAATMGEMRPRQYLAKKPSRPSMMPPTMAAPSTAPKPHFGPTKQKMDTKVKLTPMTSGRRAPIFHTAKSWTSVPTPATIMAVWMREAVSCGERPHTPATIMIGAILATNMARTCWRPKGTERRSGTLPSRV